MVKTEFGYLDPLRVENVSSKEWRILERFRLQGSKGDIFEVEAGEVTDFATVPWWTQAVIPRTGTWTKAAVFHDKMCNLLNAYYKRYKEWEADWLKWTLNPIARDEPQEPEKPIFSSIDTDAIFHKNAREEGTDPIRSELLWFGVRTGSLINAARRDEWIKTFPRWFADLVVILAVLTGLIVLISWAWPW